MNLRDIPPPPPPVVANDPERYMRLRPADEYDGRSPARWFAVIINEYSDQPELMALDISIGVQHSDRCCFHYLPTFSLEDLPCSLATVTCREPPPTQAELLHRKLRDNQRSREWHLKNRNPPQKPHQL